MAPGSALLTSPVWFLFILISFQEEREALKLRLHHDRWSKLFSFHLGLFSPASTWVGRSETVSLLKWSFSFPEFNLFFLFCLFENTREALGKWCPVELFRFCPLGGGSAQFSIFVPELEQNQPLKQFCLFHFEPFFMFLTRISCQHMDC